MHEIVLNYHHKIEKRELIRVYAPANLHTGTVFPAFMQQEALRYVPTAGVDGVRTEQSALIYVCRRGLNFHL